MPTILCYGDSNSWGYIPGSPIVNQTGERLPFHLRWNNILQHLLGKEYQVIETNLNGRTTAFDESPAGRASRNGLATLPLVLDMNYPIDIVIFMLGTNDTKIALHNIATINTITEGMRSLIHVVKNSYFGPERNPPKILVIAPPPILTKISGIAISSFDQKSVEISQKFSSHYQALAKEESCEFLDAGPLVEVSEKDSIHIAPESQEALAKAVYAKILDIMNK